VTKQKKTFDEVNQIWCSAEKGVEEAERSGEKDVDQVEGVEEKEFRKWREASWESGGKGVEGYTYRTPNDRTPNDRTPNYQTPNVTERLIFERLITERLMWLNA